MGTFLMWALIIGVVAYAANIGGFQGTVNNLFGGSSSGSDGGSTGGVPTDEALKLCPTDGVTTYTLNTQDALTTTATNLDVEYYVFNGNKLIKEGTTGSDGTVSFDVACGKDYKLLLVNTTTGTSNGGVYAKTLDLKARIAEDTVNEELVSIGQAKILGIENPADPSRNANISIVASQTKQFDIKFSANVTQKGYNQPIILCQANVTSIADVNIGSFSDGTPVKEVTSLPKRVSATAGYAYYGFEYPKLLEPGMGVVTASGSIVASATTPSTADSMDCKIVDQATWKTSGYKVATSPEEAFKTGAENTETNADVGGTDSSVVVLEFTHASGY